MVPLKLFCYVIVPLLLPPILAVPGTEPRSAGLMHSSRYSTYTGSGSFTDGRPGLTSLLLDELCAASAS